MGGDPFPHNTTLEYSNLYIYTIKILIYIHTHVYFGDLVNWIHVFIEEWDFVGKIITIRQNTQVESCVLFTTMKAVTQIST